VFDVLLFPLMATLDTIVNVLNTGGVSAFGHRDAGAVAIVDEEQSTPTVNGNFSLQSDTETWLAPVAGTLRKIEDSAIRVTLIGADGTPLAGPGMLLTVGQQAHLRLARLYAQGLENAQAPGPSAHADCHFVPCRAILFRRGVRGRGVKRQRERRRRNSARPAGSRSSTNAGMIIDPLAVARRSSRS
jgi:hypothetical protein